LIVTSPVLIELLNFLTSSATEKPPAFIAYRHFLTHNGLICTGEIIMRPFATWVPHQRAAILLSSIAFSFTLSPPAAAVDIEKLGRAIEQVSRTLEQQAREQELQDRAAAAERAEQERQNRIQDAEHAQREAARQQEEAMQRQRRQQILTPPATLGGHIALHRELLNEQAAVGQSADLDVMTSMHSPAISPDGSMVAWEAVGGQVQLRKMSTGDTRVLGQMQGGESSVVQFVGNEAVLVSNTENGTTLFDLQGGKPLWVGAGTSYPTQAGDRWLFVRSAMEYKNDTVRCTGMWLHDAKGKELSGMRLNASGCTQRVTPSGAFEILTDDKNVVTYTRGGLKQIEFRGDNRRSQYNNASYMWLGDSPLVFSTLYDNVKWYSPRIWDLATGRMLCEIASSELLIGIDGKLAYSSYPAAKISLPDCRQTPLGNGRQKLYLTYNTNSIEQYLMLLLDDSNGQVDVLDANTGHVRTRLQTQQIRPADKTATFMPSFVALPDGAIASGNYNANVPVEVFDSISGKQIKTFPNGYIVDRYAVTQSLDFKRNIYQYRLWDLTTKQERIDEFLARLKKDKFETSTDYRRRVAALTHPYSIKVNIADYDADRGQFLVSWRDIPFTVPMAPDQARKFSGRTEMTLQGELAMLEGEFLELRNAEAKGPAGDNIPLSIAREAAPARKAAKAVETAPAPKQNNSKAKRSP